MIAFLAAIAIQASSSPPPAAPTAAAAADQAIEFFSAASKRARVLGSCAAFSEPDALVTLSDSILGLEQLADIRTEFSEPLRAILAESYAEGARTPVESELNKERCDALRKATSDEMMRALPGLQSTIDFAEGRSAR
ncbi:hypothetical protein [Brevundimonas sp. NPDC058933]|uniref:hypothetical protein n=1 Tax=Brevundimonas sp. NPDC058933 TaxID=3346673 RepID=UPI003BEEBDB1